MVHIKKIWKKENQGVLTDFHNLFRSGREDLTPSYENINKHEQILIHPDHEGIWVKSSCQYFSGDGPWHWTDLSNEGGIRWICGLSQSFPGGSVVKNLPANVREVGDVGLVLSWEDPLEEGMATHSSILAWKIPWTEEPGRFSPCGSQRAGHDWACMHAHTGYYGSINQGHVLLVLLFFQAPSLKNPFVLSPIVHPSQSGWDVSSQWVSIVGSQELEPCPPPYTSLCFLSQSLISQHVCVPVGSTGPGWGVQGGPSLEP